MTFLPRWWSLGTVALACVDLSQTKNVKRFTAVLPNRMSVGKHTQRNFFFLPPLFWISFIVKGRRGENSLYLNQQLLPPPSRPSRCMRVQTPRYSGTCCFCWPCSRGLLGAVVLASHRLVQLLDASCCPPPASEVGPTASPNPHPKSCPVSQLEVMI